MIKALLSIFKHSEHSFENQEEGEDVILLLRKHYFPVSIRLGFFSSLSLIPIVLWAVFHTYLVNLKVMPLFLFGTSLWYMAFWLVIFHSLTLYTLDVLVVTNNRIIDNNQHGFFDREVSELPLSRVQDISVHIHGVMETFLKYGSLVIQSAGSERQFIFKEVPKPEEVKDAIMQTVATRQTGVRPVHN